MDLLVVGAGPAGAAAALRFLQVRPSARVVLIDRAAFPRDKVCGDAVSAEGVAELDRLGARSVLAGHPPVRAVRVRSAGGREVRGTPPTEGHVVPRAVLDARLVEVAVARGADLRRGRLTGLTQGGGEVRAEAGGAVLAAPVLVGADGAHSAVRRLAGVPAPPAAHTAIALRGYGPAEGRGDELYLDWSGARRAGISYAWSFPLPGGRVNAGYGLPLTDLTGGRAQLSGELRRHLPDVACDPATLAAHHLPLSTARPAPWRGRVLLAGDAASLVNPLTGEGIFYALASGRHAADAALTAPAAPGPAHAARLRAHLGRHLRDTAVLARVARLPGLTDVLVRAAADPRVLQSVADIAFGKGALTPALAARVAAAWLRRR